MQTVECPHCAAHLANDGTMAGQTLSCPTCGGHFQMPALVPQHEADHPGPDFEDGPTRRRRPRKAGGGTGLVLFALVVLPLCTLVITVLLFLTGVFSAR